VYNVIEAPAAEQSDGKETKEKSEMEKGRDAFNALEKNKQTEVTGAADKVAETIVDAFKVAAEATDVSDKKAVDARKKAAAEFAGFIGDNPAGDKAATKYALHQALQKKGASKAWSKLSDDAKKPYKNLEGFEDMVSNSGVYADVGKKGRNWVMAAGAAGLIGAGAAAFSKRGETQDPETGETKKGKFGFGRIAAVTVGVVVAGVALMALTRKDAKLAEGFGAKVSAAFHR
jgi:hypothetical protein